MRSELDICIVCDKWCDGNPNVGISNNYNNIIISLRKGIPDIDISILHYDELLIKHGKHIDTVLPFITADIFIFCFLGDSKINPSPQVISNLKGKKIFIWPDTVWPWITDTIRSINEYADLHVAFDGLPDKSIVPVEALTKFAGPGIDGITPQNPDLYYPEQKEIDICFLGTVHSNRERYIEELKNLTNYKVVVGGGQREGKLSAKDYAQIIRKSKFCINLPLSPTGKRQLKGRAIESMASKTCVMEETPSPLSGLLTSDQFIPITSPSDIAKILLEKTDGEISKITESAYDVYKSKCSPSSYWNNLLDKID